jgi:CobQ-like glutamine amidotransferase family enzyme
VIWLYPDLLSTYADRGHLLILALRAERLAAVS